MSPLEAMIIIREYQAMPYKNKAAAHVVSQARRVLTDEATRLMQEHVKPLCTTCWGDGFNRVSESILSGPCEACKGSGKRS